MASCDIEQEGQKAAISDLGFGSTFIIHPRTKHTHTAIVLHGRGSTGEEFAEEFSTSTLPSHQNLPDKLPGWRWVFPSSPESWSTTFREYMPAWFEAQSLTDPSSRQDLQVDGIKAAVQHVLQVVEGEIKQLDGDTKRLVLGGISQGGAIGMWSLLCWKRTESRLGGFFGASTWLPFANNIERVYSSRSRPIQNAQCMPGNLDFDDFVESMLPHDGEQEVSQNLPSQTPMFLGHGADDAYVDVKLGRQAANTFIQLGLPVEWKEYSGAEQEGHWFKVPEEMDDIHEFLIRVAHST